MYRVPIYPPHHQQVEPSGWFVFPKLLRMKYFLIFLQFALR